MSEKRTAKGNTLSLIQTKAVLEDGVSIGGKTLREIYEVVNHQKAFRFIKKYSYMPYRAESNTIELAAWTHAEFVKIHPYADGNGRVSRMIMNYQLMANGFLPVSIAKENRLEYFEALEVYAVNGELQPFIDMIASLEEQRLDEYLNIERTGNDDINV